MSDKNYFFANLTPGEKVSKAIVEAAVEFELLSGQKAEFAFIRTVPQMASDGIEVKGVMLIQAGWVPPGQVCISGMGLGF